MIETRLRERMAFSPMSAVSRQELSALTRLSDRSVRRQIEKERGDGALICSSPDGDGYYIAADMADILRHVRIERARIGAIERALAPFEEALRR